MTYWQKKNRERSERTRNYINGKCHLVTVWHDLARKVWRA